MSVCIYTITRVHVYPTWENSSRMWFDMLVNCHNVQRCHNIWHEEKHRLYCMFIYVFNYGCIETSCT